jgi:hypothetical protein
MLKTVQAWVAANSGRGVDVELAGRVFGGRHGESPQMPRAVLLQDDGFSIRFGTTEELALVRPAKIDVGPDGDLIIGTAARAIWAWHYYGRPQVPENRCRETFTPVGEHVEVSSEGPSKSGVERWLLGAAPLVRLVWVGAPSNKGMKLTKPEHIGASQLIPGVRRTRWGCE